MRDYGHDEVGIPLDLEVESPFPVNTSLPTILGFVVLLRAERRVVKGLFQELYLLEKSLLYRSRSLSQGFSDRIAVSNLHLRRLGFLMALRLFTWAFRWAIMSSTVLKGP